METLLILVLVIISLQALILGMLILGHIQLIGFLVDIKYDVAKLKPKDQQ